MTELLIRDLSLDEIDVAANFFHRWWRPDHIFYRQRELLKWQYHGNPLASSYSEGLTFKAAFHDETVVGVFAYMPFAFNRFGHRDTGVHLSAWWVHPDYRRGSSGGQLLNSLQHRMGFNACVAGMNTPVAEAYYDRMGWVVQRCIPRWVLPLNEDRMRLFVLPAASVSPNVLSQPFTAAFDTDLRSHNREIVKLTNFGDLAIRQWDSFFWSTLAPRYIGPARELAYLRWRYGEIPIFSYDIAYDTHAGEVDGLVVFRRETVRDSNQTVVRIVELIGTDEAMLRLVQYVVAVAQAHDAVMVDCFSTHCMHHALLSNVGFLDAVEDGEDRYWLAHLFQPLDHVRTRLNTAWWIRDVDIAKIARQEQFLLMKGDYEFDRPN